MDSNTSRYLAFEDFVIDTRRRTLMRDGVDLPISSRQFDLLLVLIRNEGRTLTHDELLDEVWAGTFVEQSNLKKGISGLRSVLGETPSSSAYIKTIPRKGYSFVSPVRAFDEEPQTVSVVATEIVVEEEIIDDGGAISDRPGNRARQLLITALIAGLLLIGAAAALRIWRSARPEASGFVADRIRIARVTDDGNCWDASISADGNFILCGRRLKDGWALTARQIAASSEIILVQPEKGNSFYSFRVSPDGGSVFYILNSATDDFRNGLYQIPFLGGAPRKIANNAAGHITVAPDGRSLAFVRIAGGESRIVVIGTDGTGERQVNVYGAGHRVWGLNYSPDGGSLLCSVRRQDADKMTGFVEELDLEGGSSRRIFESADSAVFSAAWLADRSAMILGLRDPATQDQQIWQFAVDSGSLFKVTNDPNSYRFPAINKAGTIILATQERMPATLIVADPRSDSRTSFTADEAKYSNVSWIPGGRIMFTSYESGGNAVWVMNTDGSGRRRLTDGNDKTELSPRLAGDGKTVVFNSARGGTHALWKVGLDGLGLDQITPNSPDMVWEGRILNDGESAVWQSQGADGNFLWLRRNAAEQRRVSEREIHIWDLSPDEKMIVAGIADSAGKGGIEIISLETGETVRRFDAVPEYILRWSPDGHIIYDTQIGGRMEVRRQSADGGNPKLIFERDGEINEILQSFDVEPGSGRIAYSISKLLVDAVTIRGADSK